MSKPRYRWWSYVRAVIRDYPTLERSPAERLSQAELRERNAVRDAVRTAPKEQLAVIRLVFWDKSHTLSGAAMSVPCSYHTAKRYQQNFVLSVAKNLGLLGKDGPREPKK